MKALVTVQVDFKSQLRRQLGFIERSAQMFDEGHTDEAIRIAVSIRVLLHNTEISTGLLAHLNARDIPLASSFRDDHPDAQLLSTFGTGIVGDKEAYMPPVWPLEPPFFLPASEWWEQVVFIAAGMQRYSRKELVLNAANKDGGAHVEEKFNKKYHDLSNEWSRGIFVFIDGEGEFHYEPMLNNHLTCLRQMAFELLHSPELTKLAE